MRTEPPEELVAQLERLGLASRADVEGVAARVRRLARDLPKFESVWIDALAQARKLTTYQAAELNAGRGAGLAVGDYVIRGKLPTSGFGEAFAAARRDVGQQVTLWRVPVDGATREDVERDLGELIQKGWEVDSPCVALVSEVVEGEDACWVVTRMAEGTTAGKWMVHNGRFPPEAVLEIARQMVAALAACEAAGIVPGDLSVRTLVLGDDGWVVMPAVGLRGVVRREESAVLADLPPEAYETVAPERVAEGSGVTAASEIYAAAAVWWHLLAGRSARAGATSAAKLRMAMEGKVEDIRTVARDVSPVLAGLVMRCQSKEPAGRCESFAEMARMLGPSTAEGRQLLVRCLNPRVLSRRPQLRKLYRAGAGSARTWAGGLAGGLLAAAVASWPVWGPTAATLPARIGGSFVSPGPQTAGENIAIARDASALVMDGDREEPRPFGPPSSDVQEHREAGERQGHAADAEMLRRVGAAWSGGGGRARAADRDAVRREVGVRTLKDGEVVSLSAASLEGVRELRAEEGGRATVAVSEGPVVLRAAEVVFENLDFVWSGAKGDGAMLAMHGESLEARRCTFQCLDRAGASDTGDVTMSVVQWQAPTEGSGGGAALPLAELRMTDCVVRGARAVLDFRGSGAVSVEMANCLVVGGGAVVRMARCPRRDEPVMVSLEGVTVRDGEAVVDVMSDWIEETPGSLRVYASGSVFAPGASGGLYLFRSASAPTALLQAAEWSGQGSIVTSEAALAVWQRGTSRQRAQDDVVRVSGLVRSGLEFAGESGGEAKSSRVVEWQVPLKSADPPGFRGMPEVAIGARELR